MDCLALGEPCGQDVLPPDDEELAEEDFCDEPDELEDPDEPEDPDEFEELEFDDFESPEPDPDPDLADDDVLLAPARESVR